MSIGEIIYAKRKALNMTQKDLAQKLNISDRTVSRWECGNSLPDVVMLKTVAKVLDMEVTEFYDDVAESEINDAEAVDYERLEQYKRGLVVPFLLLAISLVALTIIKHNYIEIWSEPRLTVWDPDYNAYITELYRKTCVGCMITLCAFVCSTTCQVNEYLAFRRFYLTKSCREIYVDISRRVNIVYIIFALIYLFVFIVSPYVSFINWRNVSWDYFFWKLL